MLPAGGHIKEQRSRLFVGQHVLQLGCYFRRAPESPSVGPTRRDEEPTSTRNLPSTKRRDEFLRTPEQVCGMSPCERPRLGLGCHYLQCSLQALPSSTP